MFLRLISDISVRPSMKGLLKGFSLSLHRAGHKRRRCSTVSSSFSSLQLLLKSFCGASSLPACVPTSQWPVRAQINMPHSVRLSLSNSEVYFCLSQAMSGERYHTVVRFANALPTISR